MVISYYKGGATMNFLEKLDFLMEKYELNKRTLSQKSDIPYTTIDAWYKKGYEGLKLTTLRKLNDYFNTTLDFWVLDEVTDPNYGKTTGFKVEFEEMQHIKKYRQLDAKGQQHVTSILDWELERTQAAQEQTDRIAELENNTCPRYFMTYYQKLASAGTGEYLFDDVPTDTIEVPCNELSAQADFVIGVNGDSMEPDYYDGEKVYVRKTDDLSVGKVGIFVQGSECFIKEKGTDCLISRNKDYPDIIPASDMQLIGEVIGKLE